MLGRFPGVGVGPFGRAGSVQAQALGLGSDLRATVAGVLQGDPLGPLGPLGRGVSHDFLDGKKHGKNPVPSPKKSGKTNLALEKSQFHPPKKLEKTTCYCYWEFEKDLDQLGFQHIFCRNNLWKHWFERHKNPRFPGHFSLPTRWSLVIETVPLLSFEPLLFNQWMLQCLLILRSNLAYDNHEHHGFLWKWAPKSSGFKPHFPSESEQNHSRTHVGVSENSVPLNPMVLLIIIPMKNGYFIGNIPNIFRQSHITTGCIPNNYSYKYHKP